MKRADLQILNEIAGRAHLILNQMIFLANHRPAKKGDPKVGGHASASAGALHIAGALHLVVKSGFDHIVNKPHASPADHAYNYLLNLLLDKNLKPLSPSKALQALRNFRSVPQNQEVAFQSYHSYKDPDSHNFLPSGTVGIPPVMLGYLALAYKVVELQNYKIPKAHFWAIIGDSEFREGSLMEAIPDFAERGLGNLTWIIDYNRQSLDGIRFVNEKLMAGSDAHRIEKMVKANGWDVIQVKHGSVRKKLFKKPHGKIFQRFLEETSTDADLHALLNKTGREIKASLQSFKSLNPFLSKVSDKELEEAIRDFGGHDFESLIEAMENSKKNSQRPCLIIAHTVKGWGLEMAGQAGNHSSIASKAELQQLSVGLKGDFPLFDSHSKAGIYLKKRGMQLYKSIWEQKKIKETNQKLYKRQIAQIKEWPKSFSLDFQKMSFPHTQWMLGQITAKLSRVATSAGKTLKKEEKILQPSAKLFYCMSPDVGTSTNLSVVMNEKVFGPKWVKDQKTINALEDKRSPNLISEEKPEDRFIRFEIAEANSISCMAAFGKMRDILGVPLLPLMTLYDFFIKRALDQFFYSLYWNSSFILVGTPSGVTLSHEGAQHGWKSDFQVPHQIIWEPLFLREMDWIFADSLKRHMLYENQGRTGVLIRAVTRGVDQKEFLKALKTQKRFEDTAEEKIWRQVRQEVLSGAYKLFDYQGYDDYKEEENVVHIFAMGSPSTSAIEASRALLDYGVYANLVVVTSPCLLLGHLAYADNYMYLRKKIGFGGHFGSCRQCT